MKEKQQGFATPLVIALILITLSVFLYSPTSVNDNNTDGLPPMFDTSFCSVLTNNTPVENLNLENYILKKTSGYCPIDIGHETRISFVFENTSASSTDPEFTLKLYDSNKKLLQTLPIEYNWEISQNTVNLHDDINFDGYKDILLKVFGPRSSEFTYYIYNPTLHIFEESETLSYIFLPTFDAENATISATADTPNYYQDEHGEQQYYTPEEQTTRFKFENGTYTEK